MRQTIVSRGRAATAVSGPHYRIAPEGVDAHLSIGAERGELLTFDGTLWTDETNIIGYEPFDAEGNKQRPNMLNGMLLNGARVLDGLRLRVMEGETDHPVRITRMDTNNRETLFAATAGNGVELSGEMFVWGPMAHDVATLYVQVTATNTSDVEKRVWIGVEQPTPAFEDTYALRGYIDRVGPQSEVKQLAGRFVGWGPDYADDPGKRDPWVRVQRVMMDDERYWGDPHRPGREVVLQPGESTTLTVAFHAYSHDKDQTDGDIHNIPDQIPLPFENAKRERKRDYDRFMRAQPHFFCEAAEHGINPQKLNNLAFAAREAQYLLRFPYKTEFMPEPVHVPVAGLPDFVTLFGRDSLITLLLCNMPVQEAKSILQTHFLNLNSQGFIPHELGQGPRINETPFNLATHALGQACQAYDAQNLLLLGVNKYWKETGDASLIVDHWKDIQRLRDWNTKEILQNGLIAYNWDGDEAKLKDLGWMDGGFAIQKASEGANPESGSKKGEPFLLYPKATVELQALYYKGLLRETGWLQDPHIAAALREKQVDVDALLAERQQQMADFKSKFDEIFWNAELGAYTQAVGQDANGNWVQNGVLASNIHYLIGSGLIEGERLKQTIRTILDPEQGLFNPDVGIRTVSNRERFYDPELYQQGSSWPFDTAMAAMHLKEQRRLFLKTGDKEGAELCRRAIHAYAKAMVSVAMQNGDALSEHLNGDTGKECLGGNKPQLWSVGALQRMEMLVTQLEIDAREIDARGGLIHLNPTDALQDFTLLNIPAGQGTFSLRYRANAEKPLEIFENTTGCKILLFEQEPEAVHQSDHSAVWPLVSCSITQQMAYA